MEKDKITLQEIAAILAEKSGVSKQNSETFCKELFGIVEEVLINRDTLKISGLGTFKTQFVEPRRSVNVNTGEEMIIEGHNKVVFLPEKSLKEIVNQPFAHLLPVEIEDGTTVDFEKNKFSEENDEEESSEQNLIEPLKTLEEQAFEIKNILAQINEMSGEATDSEKTEKSDIPTQETENQDITEKTDDLIEEKLKERKAALTEGKYSPFYNDEKSNFTEEKEETKAKEINFYKNEDDYNSDKKSGIWSKILLTTLLILLAVVLAYLFIPMVKTKIDGNLWKIKKTQIAADTIRASDLLKMNAADSLKNDSASLKNVKTPTAAPKTDSISKKAETPKIEQKIAQQSPDYKKIKATEIVSRGTTFASLARKYYGHPYFWVYIFEANKNTIKNPDNLEIGTKINIPDIDKNFIDLKNPETLKQAQKLAKQIK